jgi:hypothetical protein
MCKDRHRHIHPKIDLYGQTILLAGINCPIKSTLNNNYQQRVVKAYLISSSIIPRIDAYLCTSSSLHSLLNLDVPVAIVDQKKNVTIFGGIKLLQYPKKLDYSSRLRI